MPGRRNRDNTTPLARWLQLHSYRLRLLAALLTVLLLTVGLIIRFGIDAIDNTIEYRIAQEERLLSPLLNAALSIPLAQRDYASLEQVLRDTANERDIDYLVLRDNQGKTIAMANWDPSQPLPETKAGFDLARDARFNVTTPISLGGQPLGRLHYGIALADARQRRETLVQMALTAGAAGLVLALFLSIFLAFGMTRRLTRLVAASAQLAEGRLATRIDDQQRDEIGYVAQALDAMARNLEESMLELRTSEAQLALVMRGTSDGIWDWDVMNDRYHVSPRYRELLGYSEAELPDERASFLGIVHPDDLPRVTEAVRRHFTERVPYDVEYRLHHRDGSWRWFRGRGQAVWGADGRVVRFAGSSSDINPRKRAEDEIRKLNEELEERVRIRTAELTVANRELEAFSYSVSHDLVAPLRAIDGFSRLLGDDYGSTLGAQGRKCLERIRAGTQRMQQLIDDMLFLARVSRDSMTCEDVDLSLLAREIIDDLKQLQPRRHVEISIAPAIIARGDPRLLRIVLDNLLRNAWKFTARRPVAEIELGVLHEDGKAMYFVSDNGAGFDMQYADKLFGAFQRMHRAEDFEGTGIGLATVHRIIQRHGGRIWADAAPGKGATFYFTLS